MIPGREVSGVALPAADDTTAFQAPLRLDAYLGGPVVLVVGTGELQRVRRPMRAGCSPSPAVGWPMPRGYRRLFLIATSIQKPTKIITGCSSAVRVPMPGSSLAARETEKWPVQSDGRQLSFAGQQFLRSELTAVVYAVRDSSRPGLATIVADGEPILDGAAFPWQGMGSLLWQQSGDHPRYMR